MYMLPTQLILFYSMVQGKQVSFENSGLVWLMSEIQCTLCTCSNKFRESVAGEDDIITHLAKERELTSDIKHTP